MGQPTLDIEAHVPGHISTLLATRVFIISVTCVSTPWSNYKHGYFLMKHLIEFAHPYNQFPNYEITPGHIHAFIYRASMPAVSHSAVDVTSLQHSTQISNYEITRTPTLILYASLYILYSGFYSDSAVQ